MSPALPRPSVLFPLALILALAACNPPPPPQPSFPEIRFTDKPPISLDVKEIRIEESYLPPMKPPNVEHLFPVPPASAARTWAQDRLRAVGRFGIAKVTIENAAVISEALPIDKGFTGLFKKQQAEMLIGTLKVRVEIPGDGGMRGGFAEATANARHSVPENVSLNGRDEIEYGLTKELISEFDGNMEAAIRQHLGMLVR